MLTPASDAEGRDSPDESPTTNPKSGAGDHSQQRDHGDEEGEDEGGAPTEGDYSGLKENQKPID